MTAERAKFVDDCNYDAGVKTLDDVLQEVETAISSLPTISRLKSFISTLGEELETLGFSVRQQVLAMIPTANGRKSGMIPIICTKFGFQIALRICETKPMPQDIQFLSGSKSDGKIIIIRKPSEYAKIVEMGPPKGVNKQVFLGQPKSRPIAAVTPNISAAAGEGKIRRDWVVQDGVGGRAVVTSLEKAYSRSLRYAPRAAASSKPLRASVREKILKPGSGPKLDWEAIDKYGNPIVSFDPGHPLRDKIVKVIEELPEGSKVRKQILNKLTTEASRIYERYRRAERKSRGGLPSFIVQDSQRPKLEKMAVGCIHLGITPRQVLEYWHARVGDYTNGQLQIPGLGFLCQFNNLDTVACSGIGTPKTPKKDLKTAVDRNSFSAVDGLDVRLRSALERGGFDTTEYNDRYLLSVQHNAVSIASGREILVVDGKFGRMIRFAAETLYAA